MFSLGNILIYSFSSEPANVTLTSSSSFPILAGETVSLTCSVSLPPGVTGSLVFQWGGPGVTDSNISEGAMSSILTVSQISTSVAGIYNCTVSLDGSPLPTVSTNITVQGTVVKPGIDVCFITISSVQTPTPTITNTTLTAGTNGNLTCSYSDPPFADRATATWTVDGTPVTTSARVSTDGPSLIFSPFTTSDTGNYICSLTLDSLAPYIIVQGEQPSQMTEIIVSSECLLLCSVVYLPALFLSSPTCSDGLSQSPCPSLYWNWSHHHMYCDIGS